MNQKSKTLLGVAVFAVFLAAAFFMYNFLTGNDAAAPDNFMRLDINAANNNRAQDYEDTGTVPIAQANEDDYESDMPSSQYDDEQPTVPNFTMLDALGNEVQLYDILGKPIVLNFWTTWCPSCVVESPYFEALYLEYGDVVQVIKVNLLDGSRETRENVDRFMSDNDYTFPLFFDVTAAAVFGVSRIPQTFFITEDGIAIATIRGPARMESLRQGVEALLDSF